MTQTKFAAVLVLLVLSVSSSPLARADDLSASNCQAIYNEVWELRANEKEGQANSLHSKARNKGCFEPPISAGLCPILQQQEIQRESEGNTGLAGVIRAQKRRFACV